MEGITFLFYACLSYWNFLRLDTKDKYKKNGNTKEKYITYI